MTTPLAIPTTWESAFTWIALIHRAAHEAGHSLFFAQTKVSDEHQRSILVAEADRDRERLIWVLQECPVPAPIIDGVLATEKSIADFLIEQHRKAMEETLGAPPGQWEFLDYIPAPAS